MIEGINNDKEFQQVYGEIIQTLQDTMRMGASDNSEKEKLENLLNRFTEGTIKPSEARQELEKYKNSKQDYH